MRCSYSAVVSCLLLGCIKEKYTVPSEKGDALVQLNIGTRAAAGDRRYSQQTTRLFCTRCAYTLLLMDNRPDTHTQDGLDVNNPSFLMHLTMYSTMTQKVDFYVVANEAAMETPGLLSY